MYILGTSFDVVKEEGRQARLHRNEGRERERASTERRVGSMSNRSESSGALSRTSAVFTGWYHSAVYVPPGLPSRVLNPQRRDSSAKDQGREFICRRVVVFFQELRWTVVVSAGRVEGRPREGAGEFGRKSLVWWRYSRLLTSTLLRAHYSGCRELQLHTSSFLY